MNDLIRELERNIDNIESEIEALKEQLKNTQSKYKPFVLIEDSVYHYLCEYIYRLKIVIELIKLNIEVH